MPTVNFIAADAILNSEYAVYIPSDFTEKQVCENAQPKDQQSRGSLPVSYKIVEVIS